MNIKPKSVKPISCSFFHEKKYVFKYKYADSKFSWYISYNNKYRESPIKRCF